MHLLDGLERRGVDLRLPPRTRVFETGGFKSREGEISRPELLARLGCLLGVQRRQIVREYGMTELTSQAYSVPDEDDLDLFATPPWLRIRALDPVSLEPVRNGEVGLLSAFDLGNLGSVSHILTEDLCRMTGPNGRRFELLGRAAGAELRGCSLTVEELRSGAHRASATS